MQEINARLLQMERTFTLPQGLKQRPWFKHQIYAPGTYTGYGAKSIPAVREPLEDGQWQDAEQGAATVGQLLMNQASLVDSLAQQLEEIEGKTPAVQMAQRTAPKARNRERQQAGR